MCDIAERFVQTGPQHVLFCFSISNVPRGTVREARGVGDWGSGAGETPKRRTQSLCRSGTLPKPLPVKLSYYDTSSSFFIGPNANYSPAELGLSTDAAMNVRALFLEGAAAVTTVDRSNMFLSGSVFTRSNNPMNLRRADTVGFIVHELFHAAGFDKNLVDSQAFQDSIRKAGCRTTGSDQIVLRK